MQRAQILALQSLKVSDLQVTSDLTFGSSALVCSLQGHWPCCFLDARPLPSRDFHGLFPLSGILLKQIIPLPSPGFHLNATFLMRPPQPVPLSIIVHAITQILLPLLYFFIFFAQNLSLFNILHLCLVVFTVFLFLNLSLLARM